VLNAALTHIAMRPTKQQVAVEMAEWKAARPAALAGISRHVADRYGLARTSACSVPVLLYSSSVGSCYSAAAVGVR
jgi:hypothetical protein